MHTRSHSPSRTRTHTRLQHTCMHTNTTIQYYSCSLLYYNTVTHVQTLIAEKAALLRFDDASDLSNALHRQRRLMSVEREIIALTDKVHIMYCV